MAIVIKIPARTITATTKAEIMNKITGYNIWARGDYFRNNGRFLSKGQDRQGEVGVARLYSLEKHRRKVEVTTRVIKRGKRKGEVEKTIKVLRRGHWVAHYYDVPVANILEAKQNTRNFTLTTKA